MKYSINSAGQGAGDDSTKITKLEFKVKWPLSPISLTLNP